VVEGADLKVRHGKKKVPCSSTVTTQQRLEGRFTPKHEGEYTITAVSGERKLRSIKVKAKEIGDAGDAVKDNIGDGVCKGYSETFEATGDKDSNLSFLVFKREGDNLVPVPVESKQDGETLYMTWTPSAVGLYEVVIRDEDKEVKRKVLECKLPRFAVEGPCAKEAVLNQDNLINIVQYHPYRGNPVPLDRLEQYTVQVREIGKEGEAPGEDLDLEVLGQSVKDRAITFIPLNKKKHEVVITADGGQVKQDGLPHPIKVVLSPFDSHIRMYFGDEDCYRRIGMAETYVTIGVNRDSDAQELVENMCKKIQSRVDESKYKRFKDSVAQYSIVEIDKPKSVPMTGEIDVKIGREGVMFHVVLLRGTSLRSPRKNSDASDPFAVVNFAGTNYMVFY
tara:strand:- start:17 stop:1195 length:1179 start_codon:yes stop_codon:yes gene_type:complete